MAVGRKLTEPPGYAAVSFVSTGMIVAGIGLAWTGLLLAAAGLILSIIEFKELQRLNPWLIPQNPEDSPLLDPAPRRIGWASLAMTVAGAGAALAAAQTTGEPLLVLGPAAIAGATTLVFNRQLRRVLEAGRPERPEPPERPSSDEPPRLSRRGGGAPSGVRGRRTCKRWGCGPDYIPFSPGERRRASRDGSPTMSSVCDVTAARAGAL